MKKPNGVLFLFLLNYVFDFIGSIFILQHCDILCYGKYHIQLESFRIKEQKKGQG